MMKGVKIGTVTGISFDPQRSDNVVLQFTIKRQYHISDRFEAKDFSNNLMGGKGHRKSPTVSAHLSPERATRCARCANAT